MKYKIPIVLNIVIIFIIIAAVGFWITRQPAVAPTEEPQPTAPVYSEAEQQELLTSIETAPVVGEDLDLTEERIDQYLEEYDRVIEGVKEIGFDSLGGLNNIAQIKRNLGDFTGAIAAWQYANFIRPDNSLSFSNLAALYHYDLRDYAKAETNYRISVNNDPDDLSTIRNFYELYYYDFEDNDKVEKLLLEFVENNPLEPDIFTLTARFYSDIGNNEKAIEFYQKHLEILPDNQIVIKEIERLQNL